jgi:curved DNA-binding protein
MESTITIDFASALRGTTLSLRLDAAHEAVQVRVPPGVSEGGRLRIAGQGGPGVMGGPPGDLLLTVHVTPHPHFKRDGDDLSLDLPISVVEAWEGAKVRVPTADGEVVLKVPPRTQSGDVTRLRGKGVQRPGRPPGDLYVKFLVRLPTGDDPAIARAMDALRAFAQDDLREAIKL